MNSDIDDVEEDPAECDETHFSDYDSYYDDYYDNVSEIDGDCNESQPCRGDE